MPFEMEFVRIAGDGGLGLAADVSGPAAGPPVVLQHGGGQSRYAWKGTGERLAAAGYRVINVDARGHGDSDWSPGAAYDMADFGRDVTAIIDWIGRPPVLIGASMGGMSALFAQAGAGDRQLFAALVLVDITPRIDPAGAERIVNFMRASPNGFATLDEVADAIAAYNPNRARSGSAEGLKRVMRQGDDGRWRWRWDPAWLASRDGNAGEGALDPAVMQARMKEYADLLHRAAALLTVPTLLVRGQQSDLVSPEAVAEFLEAAPHARFVDVSGAGHMVAGDENDVFSTAVVDFLLRAVPAGHSTANGGGATP
jgi:pimeloyl-ACP methyl ester carboxylesterase